MFSATCIAPVNIAVIKYWGKRNEALILPINDSISGTLSTNELCAKTTIVADPKFKEDRMWLNGLEVSTESERIIRCIEALKRLAEQKSKIKDIWNYKLRICSENNFPTAAGLASSAAGYACFVYTLATLYGVENEELTAIARQGSGSACRSIYGGFVRWHKGIENDGSDSIAVQVKPASHWPEMRVLIFVVSDETKKVSSKIGMKLAVETSPLVNYRASVCVPERVNEMTKAIENRDFPKFAEITMKDSNQFHEICLDTWPPCFYLNDISKSVIELVHKYNGTAGGIKVAYTFDAGPNACVYLLEEEVGKFVTFMNAFFPNDKLKPEEYLRGLPIEASILASGVDLDGFRQQKNAFKYIIHTKIGEGPQKLDDSETLFNENSFPKNVGS